MRKKRLWIIFVIFILFMVNIAKPGEEEIRIRIIASSTDNADCEQKKKICEEIVAMLEPLKKMDFITMENEIPNYVSLINEKFIDVKASYEYHNFPDKTYNGEIIEAENVKTLLIQIGQGEGDNWWGTLYPVYLGISSDEKVEYRFWLQEIWKDE